METREEKLARVLTEPIEVVDYDPSWPSRFEEECRHLRDCLPPELVGRIDHFGSTAVPGLAAKPVIDMLVEVRSLDEARERIVPILEAQGYDYFWRPTRGDDTPPWYAWFIRRDGAGKRTHHIHMVEPGSEHWDRLLFRDLLIDVLELAREYAELKRALCLATKDRVAYTRAKEGFIERVTGEALRSRGK